MTARLLRFGPDGIATWVRGPVALGQILRRTVAGPSGEVEAQGDLALVADARIDNRGDLVGALGLAPDAPDGALILAAYRRWGDEAPDHLLGDFAFALWDASRRRLFCARDPFGVKPLYYHLHPGGRFAFATETGSLLALAGVPWEFNEAWISSHFRREPGLSREDTSYRGILRLLPAHTLSWESGRVSIRRYWDSLRIPQVRLGSDEAYVEAFRSHLTEAVRCRMRSPFRVGAEVSGGLDSPSIACTARDLLARGGGGLLPTFSLIAPDVPDCDEKDAIELVLARGGFEPHWVRADTLSPLDVLDRFHAVTAAPCSLPNLAMSWALAEGTRKASVRVLFGGLGSETDQEQRFRDQFKSLILRGRWITAAREVRLRSRRLGSPPLPLLQARLWGKVKNRTVDWHRVEALQGQVFETAGPLFAAFGIEMRYPYLDRRLFEFCRGIPPEQRLGQGWDRWIQRRAMNGILPDPVCWRPLRRGYAPHFLHALRTDRGAVERFFHEDLPLLSAYTDPEALRQAHRSLLEGPVPIPTALLLWKALSLSRWIRAASHPLTSG